jgi:predicted dehydrogenase
MFDKEQKNFDALIVATPDHWHSHLVLAGLAMNKHIYCAKPMTRTIAEARRVKAAALASKVTTKASLQDSRTSPARATTELLLSGAIGPDTRSALLDRHSLPQRVGQTQGGPDAARGDELGPVVRPVSGAAVP